MLFCRAHREPYLLEDLGFSLMASTGVTLVPHMLMQSLPVRKAPGVAASAHEKKVEMPPHMAEGSVRVFVNNSIVGTEGQLPSLALNVQQLPHQAPMLVEAHQQKLLVCTALELRRHYSHQAWHS